jgi:hypothetical protein
VVNGSPACFDSNLELTQGNTIKKTATDDKPLKLIAKVKITGVVSGVYWISPLNFAINSNKDYGAKFISRNGSDEILTYTDGLLNEDAVANYSDNQYHIFEIEIKNSAYVKFKVDCEDVGNYTNYYDSRIDTLWLENYHAGGVSGQDVYIDWIAVDKHIADPPMWGELGETQDIPQIVEVPINAEIPDQYSVPISVCIRYLSYMVPVSVDIPEYIDCKAPILVEVNNKFVSPLTYGVPVSVEITEDIITYNVPINLNIGAEYTFMIPVKGKILYRHYTRPNLPDKDETVSMSVGGVVFE